MIKVIEIEGKFALKVIDESGNSVRTLPERYDSMEEAEKAIPNEEIIADVVDGPTNAPVEETPEFVPESAEDGVVTEASNDEKVEAEAETTPEVESEGENNSSDEQTA